MKEHDEYDPTLVSVDALRSVERERDALKDWKTAMMAVKAEWDCQNVATLLGIGLGTSIRPQIQPKIEALIAKNDTMYEQVTQAEDAQTVAEEELRDMRTTMDRIVADDTWKDEVHCGCCVMLRAEVERLGALIDERDSIADGLRDTAVNQCKEVERLKGELKTSKAFNDGLASSNVDLLAENAALAPAAPVALCGEITTVRATSGATVQTWRCELPAGHDGDHRAPLAPTPPQECKK